jgi:hypothetical protein
VRKLHGVYILAKRIDQIKRAWNKFMFPVGADKEKDDKSLAAFLKIVDIMTNIGYGIFAIVAVISIYLFITHELL